MAAKPVAGDGLAANLAGMSKTQLYDIMSQMKALVEQNRQQAREILIQNPQMTRTLFQAQIMLGMVQPPSVIPNIQPAALQQPQQSAQPAQQPNSQSAHSLPGHQVGLQDQTSASQAPNPLRKQQQQQNQPVIPMSSAAPQSQSVLSHPLQSVQRPKAHLNAHAPAMSLPQSSQIPNMPPVSLHTAPQPHSILQPSMSSVSTQLQQPLQTSGIPHMSLQPPLPPQPRPPSMPAFSHQLHSQMGPNAAYQHSGAPQLHHSQPMFHPGNKPPLSMGPSFPQGQPPLPSQPPPQSLYQVGGSHLGAEFNSHIGNNIQTERGSPWMPGLLENTAGMQLPGPPPLVSGQMGPGNQPPRPAPLTPEMENALLQQVMSLTPEQINLLPPEQRNQVLQLQQMLRQ